MRRVVASLYVLLLITLPAGSRADPPGRVGREEVKIASLQRVWQKAYTDGDEPTVRRLVSDKFVLTNTAGVILDRSNAVSHYGTEREKAELVFEDQQVVLYSATAVATAKVRERQPGNHEILLRATDTFVKQAGTWRVAASHWTRLPPEVVEIKLSEQAQERFVGEYRGPNGGLLKVARRGGRYVVTYPRAAPIEFVAVSDTTLVDPTSNVRWLFIGETGEAFRYVVVQNATGLIKLQRA
ncbi:nuclear transport factor 2 family protein [Sphingomonas humi]|uniref:DUF4440 domain-containing protein n=1 Tax=Sphingomonas humi TaxID=335630 RepID=A0ABP7RXF0_9SPHN